MDSGDLSLWVAFGAGVASFFSPCVLPLVPSYLSYLTGYSAGELAYSKKLDQTRIFINAVAFVVGFSFVFTLLGFSMSFIGQFLLVNLVTVRKVAGVFIVVFGLHTAGVFRLHPLLKERRIGYVSKGMSIFNSFFLGVAFSFGWTPCVGPILGSILMLAAMGGAISRGGLLLSTYSFGLALPFLVTALGASFLLPHLRRFHKHLRTVEIVTGVLLVLVGILVYTDYFAILSAG